MERHLHIGIVTDEISVDLAESLGLCADWGIRHVELREGGTSRFPDFTAEEIALVDTSLATGSAVTAVSPGIFKGNASDDAAVGHELDRVLPKTIELAARWGCPRIIVFGFDKANGVHDGDRLRVQQAFEKAAERVGAAGMTVVVENEPNFWIDHAETSGPLLREIGHPSLRLNWDPGNLAWGGREVTREEFDPVRDLIANVHVKDFTPDDPNEPWRPVGEGVLPWKEILSWVCELGNVDHVTLETHCSDRVVSSERSLEFLREILNVGIAR